MVFVFTATNINIYPASESQLCTNVLSHSLLKTLPLSKSKKRLQHRYKSISTILSISFRKANWFKLQKEIEKEEADISRLVQLALIVDVKEIGAPIKEKQTRIRDRRKFCVIDNV